MFSLYFSYLVNFLGIFFNYSMTVSNDCMFGGSFLFILSCIADDNFQEVKPVHVIVNMGVPFWIPS